MQSKTKLIFVISAIVVVFAILFLTGGIKLNVGNKSSNREASTTEKTIGGITYNGSGDFKIEQVPIYDNFSAKIPDLNRPLIFPTDTSPEVKAIIERKIADNVAKLKANPFLPDEWLSLGINRKMISDYEGAKEAWEYVAIISPTSPIAFANLSDLYGYYLKDNVQAEKNYLKAIENEPTSPNYYLRAGTFYVEVVGDLSKARAILIKGLSVIPDEANMKTALESVNALIVDKSKASNSL